MKRLLFILLVPLLCAWPSMNMGGSVPAAGGGGGGWGDSCTNNDGVVVCIDFDHSSTACADTDFNGTTNNDQMTNTSSMDCDCTTNSCPLGTGDSVTNTGAPSQVRAASIFTSALTTGGEIRCSFSAAIDSNSTTTGVDDIFTFYAGGGTAVAGVSVDWDNGYLCARDQAGTDGCTDTTNLFTTDTTVEVCVEITFGSNTTDVYNNLDCSGTAHNSSSGGTTQAIDGFRLFGPGAGDGVMVWDDIKCEIDTDGF